MLLTASVFYVSPIRFLPAINSRLTAANFCSIVNAYFLPGGEALLSHSVRGKLLAGLGISAYPLFLRLYFPYTRSSMFCLAGHFGGSASLPRHQIGTAVFAHYHCIRGEADQLPDPRRPQRWLGNAELGIGYAVSEVLASSYCTPLTDFLVVCLKS
jgi:hypothetical protein